MTGRTATKKEQEIWTKVVDDITYPDCIFHLLKYYFNRLEG